MDISTLLSPQELTKVQNLVDLQNRDAGGQRRLKQVLDKDDFLKILMTQLTHQDPTEPMKDREFVAQMASFSTLEQMTNMSQDMTRIQGLLQRSEALGLLGRIVDVRQGDGTVSGRVEGVRGEDVPQLLVGGRYYDFSDVVNVKSGERQEP